MTHGVNASSRVANVCVLLLSIWPGFSVTMALCQKESVSCSSV